MMDVAVTTASPTERWYQTVRVPSFQPDQEPTGMCSRYALTSPPQAVRALLDHANELDYPPRYNIAPTQPVAIVRLDHGRRRELALVRWGLIPSWLKDPAKLSVIYNARAETAAEKPSFRGALRHRRCLVPADAYYEWTGSSGARRPFMIRPAAGGPIAFAGLWESWLGADGSELDSMAILTVPATGRIAEIHDRMPVILTPQQFEDWLDVTSGRSDPAERVLAASPKAQLEPVQVSSKLNNSRNDNLEVQEIVGRKLI